MSAAILIYGANGYTGELTARTAKERGVDCIVAGRNDEAIRAVGERYGFEHRAFSLDDPEALARGLSGVRVVLHCAGPFSHTSKPMADACLKAHAHYLDITGEISVFEALRARDDEARAAGVMLMPGVGFDVVPTDCLAAHIAAKVANPTHLVLANIGLGKISHGTATTVVENVHRGGFVRENGQLVQISAGSRVRKIDYGDGVERPSMAIPMGELSTAFVTTGIPNIEVYVAAPRGMIAGARAMSKLSSVLGSAAVQRFLKRRIPQGGPSDESRKKFTSRLYGEARNADAKIARAWLETPEGYTITAFTSLEIARRTAAGDARTGFQTPAKVFGADFILGFEGVRRRDAA